MQVDMEIVLSKFRMKMGQMEVNNTMLLVELEEVAKQRDALQQENDELKQQLAPIVEDDIK